MKQITRVYLHFGQNKGKSSSTVCGRICVLVLQPQLGQQSQSILALPLSGTSNHLSSFRNQRSESGAAVKSAGGKAGDLLDGFTDIESKAVKTGWSEAPSSSAIVLCGQPADSLSPHGSHRRAYHFSLREPILRCHCLHPFVLQNRFAQYASFNVYCALY